MQLASRSALATICLLFLINNVALGSAYLRTSGSELTLSINPSSAVIKVGANATINLSVEGGEGSGTVCFSEQGFPSSGFILTYLPQCAPMKQGTSGGQLIVEATPAAAPQNFTAAILATLGNQTASAPLTITVVPAIPAWIPWLGILLFFLVIAVALFVNPRKSRAKEK